MPIFIKGFAEPLCAPPFDPPDGPAVASSLARDTLRRVMLNYCEHTIGGRSILIAGHIGWYMQSAAGTDHAEIATQFRLDLDRQIENSELRWYWDKAPFLIEEFSTALRVNAISRIRACSKKLRLPLSMTRRKTSSGL